MKNSDIKEKIQQTVEYNKEIKILKLSCFWRQPLGKDYAGIPIEYRTDMFIGDVEFDT
jgi:hypothetical protein